jgi:hypothetical protein
MKYFMPMTVIRRRRVLPVPGKVLIRAGQKVGATDTIAETNLHPEYLLLDISRSLGLPPAKTDGCLQCQAGDQLAEQDIIAGPVGAARRVVRSPRAGKVVVAGDGQVLLEIAGQPYQIRAGLPGEVIELVAERGAVIESAGALVQGVWGNGHIDAGQLSVLATEPNHEIKPSELDVSLRGWIVLAGHCNDPEIFKAIVDLPLRGLILGSLEARLIPAALKSPVPIIVLEGFGRRPIGASTHKLLASQQRRDVALNAEAWNAFTGAKPEVFFPAVVPGAVIPAPDFVPLEVNRQVRIVRPPHSGETGTVLEIKGMTSFPGGLRARAAVVNLENGESAIIPLANLEVLV